MARTGYYEQPPARWWRIAFLVLCTVGVCLSADLIRLHIRVHTDPNYHAYCAISERVDCTTVAQSRYSVFLDLPIAVWGFVGYLLMGTLAVWGLRRRLSTPSWPFGVLFWLTAFSCVLSLALLAVSVVLVKSTCIVCDTLYVVNFALLGVAARELRNRDSGPFRAPPIELRGVRRAPAPAAALALVFAAFAAALWAGVPRYWKLAPATGPGGLLVGRTAQGQPWIGALKPVLDIVEFSDYQCPFCQRGHAEVRALIRERPDKVRLVHRQYPLDMRCNAQITRPFHPYACTYAAMAHCAGEQGRFWEANDYLFEHGRDAEAVAPDDLARAVGVDGARLRACIDADTTRASIQKDISAGWAVAVRGTPTFVVDGRPYPGRIPPEVIENALGPSPPAPQAGRSE
jgi:uncharacterized membrane protein/predicted DsbA family dithiol-disulfide isomerase